ncbi:MAG TPA: LysR substrate-binding domain-containing protein [Chloroflexota bacterium]
MLNLHQLRIFYSVAQHRSFSAAARALFMTQPAVSLQVRALEKSLGVKLFDRSARKLELTSAGEALFRSAGAILHAEDEALRVIAELRDASKAKLLVGTNTTGGMYVLPRILRAFRAAYPEVKLVLDIDATDIICERINEKILDLGVVGGPLVDRRLTVESIVDDEVVLIASPDNPLAAKGRITPPDLVGQPLIVPEPRSRTRQVVEQSLREVGLSVRPAMQLVGTEAVKKAVEANLGVAFVSVYATECEVAQGTLRVIPVEGLRIRRPLVLVYRSTKFLTPSAKRFRHFVRSYAVQHLATPSPAPA